MNIRFYIALLVLLPFLQACGEQPYVKQDSAFIVFKTPTFKYADMGFIYENSNEVKVEIYGSGQALMSLKVTENSVCLSSLACMDQSEFNRQILNSAYPDTILNNVFRGKQIFKGQNSVRSRNGFTQRITNQNKYDIEYRVLNNEIIFRDKINTILIKVKKQ